MILSAERVTGSLKGQFVRGVMALSGKQFVVEGEVVTVNLKHSVLYLHNGGILYYRNPDVQVLVFPNVSCLKPCT